jgi:plastocyanin
MSGLGLGLFVVVVTGCGNSSSSSGGGGGTATSCTPGPAGASSPAASGASPAGGGAYNICVVSDPTNVGAYNPATATVKSGSQVTWIFTDQNNQHTVTYDDNSYDSQPQSSGFTTTQTISKPAGSTIAYHCTLHSNMTGKITVQ